MRLKIGVDLNYHVPECFDVLLALEVAQLPDQLLIEDKLTVVGSGSLQAIDGEDGIGRRTWAKAQGEFKARYSALVDVERILPSLEALPVTPRAELPPEVIRYLWPSRYCEADRLRSFVDREFSGNACGATIVDMSRWVHDQIDYTPGSSNESTSAIETFVQRRGVCRDFAHLLAAFARAAGVPARLVSAYAWRLDPPDFHAVVEVWLAGSWHLIDPTQLAPLEGLVRIAAGRDAADIAFMTVFGTCELCYQSVRVEAICT